MISLYIDYNGSNYRLPIGTNILNGKQLKKLLKYIGTITIYKSTRIWINGNYITNTMTLIFDQDRQHVTCITDEWGISEENGMELPTLNVISIDDPIITIE